MINIEHINKQEFDDDLFRKLIQDIWVIDASKEEMPYGTFV